jgi:hypothetical protein
MQNAPSDVIDFFKGIDKTLKIYKEALEYAVKNNHPLNLRAWRNSNSNSNRDNQYEIYYNRIENEISPFGLKAIFRKQLVEIDNFVFLKNTIINTIHDILAKMPYNESIRVLLLDKFNLEEQQYKEYIKTENIVDDRRNFVTWFVEQYTQQRKSQVAGRQGRQKSRTNKIQLKSTGQQYVVHTKGDKERFIKQSGREVLLKNIRGQYNIVK